MPIRNFLSKGIDMDRKVECRDQQKQSLWLGFQQSHTLWMFSWEEVDHLEYNSHDFLGRSQQGFD